MFCSEDSSAIFCRTRIGEIGYATMVLPVRLVAERGRRVRCAGPKVSISGTLKGAVACFVVRLEASTGRTRGALERVSSGGKEGGRGGCHGLAGFFLGHCRAGKDKRATGAHHFRPAQDGAAAPGT